MEFGVHLDRKHDSEAVLWSPLRLIFKAFFLPPLALVMTSPSVLLLLFTPVENEI